MEVLAGLSVALVLIPEAIAFSVLAGVDPRVGLFSSVVMAISIAFLGGRPAMITAATAAVALVIGPVARDHGIDYLIATVLLGGLLQVIMAVLGVARLQRFIPRSVMTGFVNALGIMLFTSQLPHLLGSPGRFIRLWWWGAHHVAFPKVTKAIPAPLVTIVVLTGGAALLGWKVPDVSGQGELPSSLPQFFIPNVPYTWETLRIIAPMLLAWRLWALCNR